MVEVKELNIKNRAYYFFDDMINIRNFHADLLNIEKKPHKDVDMYYIGYIIIKKFNDYENIHSVNSLYLIIHSTTGHFKEKYGEKYLIIDLTEKYEEFSLELNLKLKRLIIEKDCFMKKIMLELE